MWSRMSVDLSMERAALETGRNWLQRVVEGNGAMYRICLNMYD